LHVSQQFSQEREPEDVPQTGTSSNVQNYWAAVWATSQSSTNCLASWIVAFECKEERGALQSESTVLKDVL